MDWKQLTKMKYRISSDKKVQIMSKEEMRLRGLISFSESPDVADAFFLTFAPRTRIKMYTTVATEGLKPYYPQLGI